MFHSFIRLKYGGSMRRKLSLLGVSGLVLASALFASDVQRASNKSEGEVRNLISRWVDAFQRRDFKRLAALETSDVALVDRFGDLHLASGRNENQKLWEETFEVIANENVPITVTVDHIRFLRPDVAVVHLTWEFPEGIPLVDGDRFPPFAQVDTFIVTKSQSVWLVAAHNMQENKQ